MRLYKTRSQAAEACKKGWITRDGQQLKPAHNVQEGDVIGVRRSPVTYRFKILRLSANRLGAKLVADYMENVTTPDQLELLRLQQLAAQAGRARGTGRPTKKERRDLEQFIDDDYAWSWLDDDADDS